MEAGRETLVVADVLTKNEVMGNLHPMPLLSPELQLLLCCGGPGIQAHSSKRLNEISGAHFDWEILARVALWHHMVPLLYWNLSRVERDLPSEYMQALRDSFIRNIRWSLTMTGELLTLLQDLQAHDVLAVPYKGPILALRLYGNLSLRQSADLDILVRRSELERARRVLIENGYTPAIMLHGSNQDFQIESRYSERFDRPDSTVELHWAFTNKDVAFPLNLDDVAPRLRPLQVSGRTIHVFSPEDTLLILAVHGAKHAWSSLEWICGVGELLHSQPIDWDALVQRAARSRSLRRLLLCLCLARDLYRAPLPESIEKRIRGDGQVLALAASVTKNLYDGSLTEDGIHTFGTLDHDLFHFRLGDRFADRARYLIYRMTTPSRPERWSTVTVGGRPISLHAFTRPFGILSKLVPAMWRRLGQSGSRLGRRSG